VSYSRATTDWRCAFITTRITTELRGYTEGTMSHAQKLLTRNLNWVRD